ncbi:hypothetical protein GGI43DRAFT_408051 [Trichoderma evansii]
MYVSKYPARHTCKAYSLPYRLPTTTMWLTAAHTLNRRSSFLFGAPWPCSCCTCQQRPLPGIRRCRCRSPSTRATKNGAGRKSRHLNKTR